MKAREQGIIVISTFSDEKSVRDIAGKMLDAKLCACVNYTKIHSMYSWKGKREDHDEYLALFKTTSKSAENLKKAIAKHHPYEVPEIAELKLSDLAKPYLSWLLTETSADRISQNRHDTSK